ncbi:hypothetical protein DPMN_054211 [Dreissena polymorpha]|uniref:Uncharacterized protein n=1 Tax=Dreissena polymorpha TaxID=45954 RepID=A0A9D4CPG9_DREPO|nr:hypothetical protein DPMN_054211 [Dreissena polymorpha]
MLDIQTNVSKVMVTFELPLKDNTQRNTASFIVHTQFSSLKRDQNSNAKKKALMLNILGEIHAKEEWIRSIELGLQKKLYSQRESLRKQSDSPLPRESTCSGDRDEKEEEKKKKIYEEEDEE